MMGVVVLGLDEAAAKKEMGWEGGSTAGTLVEGHDQTCNAMRRRAENKLISDKKG